VTQCIAAGQHLLHYHTDTSYSRDHIIQRDYYTSR